MQAEAASPTSLTPVKVGKPASPTLVRAQAASPGSKNTLEYKVWGSPCKKLKLDKDKGKANSGNPQRQLHEAWHRCRVCKLQKRPSGSEKKSHGAKCHWCQIVTQRFARKYFQGCMMGQNFTQLQLEHIECESTRLREEDLGSSV